jgi:hypothetical protein
VEVKTVSWCVLCELGEVADTALIIFNPFCFQMTREEWKVQYVLDIQVLVTLPIGTDGHDRLEMELGAIH